MSYLTTVDLGHISGVETAFSVWAYAGSIDYPQDLPPGTLVVEPGGQDNADTYTGGGPTVPASHGDNNGNIYGSHFVGGLGVPGYSALAPAAYYYSSGLDYPAQAGNLWDPITNPAGGSPFAVKPAAEVFWARSVAILGADGWAGLGSSGNAYTGYPDTSVPPQPLSVSSLGPMSSPGGLVVVQSGAAMCADPTRIPPGDPFGVGADFVAFGYSGYPAAIYGSVTLYEPDAVFDGNFTLPVDDRYTWAAYLTVFSPRFYKSGNVISLSKRLGRVGRAVQQITQTDNLIQPAFNRTVVTLGDNPHGGPLDPGGLNLQVKTRCWSMSLGCRQSKRWDLFACRDESSNGNLLSPVAEVIHQQSADDITSWSDPEILLAGRYHSVCHVLDGRGRLVLALWDDAARAWYLSIGQSGDGKGDWTMSEPVLLVEDAQGQASLRIDADGRFWFACVTAGTWRWDTETDTGLLRLLRCDSLNDAGAGEWTGIRVDEDVVGGGWTGVNMAIKSRGLFVFHLFRKSVSRVPVLAGTDPDIKRIVASYSDQSTPPQPNLLVFSEPVAPTQHVPPSTEYPIQPLGPGDLLPRGDGSFYWGYQDTGPIKHRILSKLLPDGSGVVT